MKHEVVILRVHRTLAGAEVPWDKLYFFRGEDRKLIPRVFPFCLVFPLNKPLVKMIKTVVNPDRIHHRPIVGKAYPIRRSDEEVIVRSLREGPSQPVLDILADHKKYRVVVPTLFHHRSIKSEKKKVKGKMRTVHTFDLKNLRPAYLNAAPKTGSIRRKKKYPKGHKPASTLALENMAGLMSRSITSRAYFLLAGEEYKPICATCSQSARMLAGECRFGTLECYNTLSRERASDFRKNLERYSEYAARAAEEDNTDVEL